LFVHTKPDDFHEHKGHDGYTGFQRQFHLLETKDNVKPMGKRKYHHHPATSRSRCRFELPTPPPSVINLGGNSKMASLVSAPNPIDDVKAANIDSLVNLPIGNKAQLTAPATIYPHNKAYLGWIVNLQPRLESTEENPTERWNFTAASFLELLVVKKVIGQKKTLNLREPSSKSISTAIERSLKNAIPRTVGGIKPSGQKFGLSRLINKVWPK
jgi:hypothetical protein